MSDIQSGWDALGLPERCPECGEDEDLSARVIEAKQSVGPMTAELTCMNDACYSTWIWERDQ